MAYMHGIEILEIGGSATVVRPVDSVAPVITSPLTATTREDTAWSMTLLADENVSFAKRSGADSAAFGLVGTTLSLPAKDYEGGQTAFVCNLVAMDSAGNVTNFAVTVTVTDVDEVPPLITSAPTATIAAATGYAVTLAANEAVTFDKRTGADTDLFALAGTTLTLPAQTYNAGKATFTANLRAVDGAGNATLFTHVVTIAQPANSGLLPLDTVFAMEGDSLSASMSLGIALSFSQTVRSGNRLRQGIGWMRAVAGRLMADMSTQTANVLTSKPAVVQFWAGVNDVRANATLAALQGYWTKCVTDYLAAPTTKFVVGGTIAPLFGGNALTTAQEAVRTGFNAWVLQQATDKIKVANVETIGLTEADTTDGLHFAWSGSIKIGNAFAAIIDTLVQPGNRLALFDTAENGFGANPLTGTTGTKSPASATMTGSVATGWALQSAADGGLTIECSKATVDGVEGQRIRVAGTATANGTINLQKSVTVNAVAGETAEIIGGLRVNSSASNLCSVAPTAGNNVQGIGRTGATRGSIPAGDYTLRSAEVGQGGTGAAASVFVQFEIKFAAGPVDFDLTIYKPIVRKLPATPLS